MKKILYVVSTLRNTGPTRQLLNIVRNLDRARFQATVMTLSPEPKDTRWTDFIPACDTVTSLNLGRVQGAFVGRNRLQRYVTTHMPDVIQTQGFRSDLLVSKLDTQAKKISTIRNYPQIDFLDYYGGIIGRWMVHRQIRALEHFQTVVCVSPSVAANLGSLGYQSDLCAIENGVDATKFTPATPVEKVQLREKLDLSKSKKIWVVLGDLLARKDPLFIANSLLDITGFEEENLVVFAGDGPLMPELRRLTDGNAGFYLAGRVEDPVALLKAADYILSASQAEGLPNAILEGMSCACPALLSDISPHKDVLGEKVEGGQLYAIGDPQSFQKAFKSISTASYDEISSAARQRIETRFTDITMSKSYQNLYLRGSI